jgi:tRNA nucleotidyltransferase (CCA-adding enzyme)
VTFTPSLEEDLKRRDFTINAMAYNDEEGLVDIFGGISDIEAGIIRCVGTAEERFNEDALRIMRAIRFSAQLGYTIEENTLNAISRVAPNLSRISAERIQVELVKLLVSDHPDYLRIAYKTGITGIILPEFDTAMETPQNHPHHQYNVGEHILHSLLEIPAQKELRIAMLLHDIGKPQTLTVGEDGITHFHGHPAVSQVMAKDILKRLKFDNDTISCVSRLVLYHDYGNGVEPDIRFVRHAVNKIGEDIFPRFLMVKRADVLAQSLYMRQKKLDSLKKMSDLYDEICTEKQCVSLKTMAVTGGDLIAAGMKPGKELGEVLDKLLQLVIDNPENNKKDFLIKKAKELSK